MTRSVLSRRPAAWMIAGLAALALGGCSIIGGGGDDEPDTPTIGNRTPILSRIATEIVADPALAGVSVVLPAAEANADWPQGGRNAAKVTGHVTLGNAPARAWTAAIAGTTKTRRLAAAPVIGGGMLFAVDGEGVIHAFDATTGARRWTHRIQVSGDLRDATFGGGATYDSGNIYATSGTGDVVALNAETGAERWRKKPAGPLRGSPTVAFNAVYVMTQDNQIHALNSANGEPVWQDAAASGQQGVFGVAAPAVGQGSVIAGYSSGEVVAYRYENGRVLWSDALARTSISTAVGSLTDVDADPIIANGQVFALGQGGRMAAYELTTGQRIWELTLAGISTPALSGEWVFTLTDDARLLAIQRGTGRVRWVTQLEAFRDPEDREGPIFWTGPVLASNRLWVASSEGEVHSVDVMTGVNTLFTELSDGVSLPPVVAGNTLYILDDGGRITAFR
ncbi:PQQ-binding-like beta-propeller repeat protein [Alteraurantiacibacter aquimixticola]|uniref:Pyrrolo-quinoline quinone n=1 Tax=Alteraurantiacibacter aquimixticola TaxID=2489173 RepID=A0A4V4U9F1_9SPHN|nr:PQQ-binding-like beta-propeller repeat protein [Alteraurantiacibacter aquimixticola]TIX50543.1 pyrrolo-quinoline quinone [Alteraurantiacibacter aquimixticola]